MNEPIYGIFLLQILPIAPYPNVPSDVMNPESILTFFKYVPYFINYY
jgi:hypothetical protein